MGKICPLMSKAVTTSLDTENADFLIADFHAQYCQKEKCAWWVERDVDLQIEIEGGCAIKRLAEKK